MQGRGIADKGGLVGDNWEVGNEILVCSRQLGCRDCGLDGVLGLGRACRFRYATPPSGHLISNSLTNVKVLYLVYRSHCRRL